MARSPARSRSFAPGSDNVAIGSRLAELLGASVGSTITIWSPEGRTTPFGTVPRIVDYRVAAIVEVGVYDFDKAFVIMPMEEAQSFLMFGDAIGMIEVKTEDAEAGRRNPRAARRRRWRAGPWSTTGAR